MTASSKSVVVWEWMNEYGRWRPYESHIANFIESSHRKNPSVQVNLGKVAPNMGIYSIDFLTMCQIRFGTGMTLQLFKLIKGTELRASGVPLLIFVIYSIS